MAVRKSGIADILRRLNEVTAWAAEGKTGDAIAAELGIARSTWFAHKTANKKIDEAFRKGRVLYRQSMMSQLENTAMKRALGYEVKEAKQIFDENKKVIRTEVTAKHVSPSDTVLIFLLQNLMPEVYKDRRNVEFTGAGGKDLEIKQVLILPDNGREKK